MRTDKSRQFLTFLLLSFAFISFNSSSFAQFSTNSPSTINPDTSEKNAPVLSPEELDAIRSFTSDTSSRKATDFPSQPGSNSAPGLPEENDAPKAYQSPLGTKSLDVAAQTENKTIGPANSSRSISNSVTSNTDPDNNNNNQPDNNLPDFWRSLFSLLIVVAVIVGLAMLSKKLFPSRMNLSMATVVKVVGRTNIDGKHGLTLVKFGNDLLLLAISGDNVRLLDKVSDPEKIAYLMGNIESERVNSISKSFSSVFGKAREQFEMDNDLEDEQIIEEFDDGDGPSETNSELDGLLKKVKGLSKIRPKR